MNIIVFFDVDGTLLPEGTSNVPESTVRAMKKLKEKDIGICLCTGRHPIELRQLDLLKYPFDGFVLLNGQLVLDKDMKVICARTIEGLDKEELLSLFNSHAAPMILAEKDRLFMNFHNGDVEQVQKEIASPIYDIGEYYGADIFMSTIFVPRGEEKTLLIWLAQGGMTLLWTFSFRMGVKCMGFKSSAKERDLAENPS